LKKKKRKKRKEKSFFLFLFLLKNNKKYKKMATAVSLEEEEEEEEEKEFYLKLSGTNVYVILSPITEKWEYTTDVTNATIYVLRRNDICVRESGSICIGGLLAIDEDNFIYYFFSERYVCAACIQNDGVLGNKLTIHAFSEPEPGYSKIQVEYPLSKPLLK
jgi:hypothetical protein